MALRITLITRFETGGAFFKVGGRGATIIVLRDTELLTLIATEASNSGAHAQGQTDQGKDAYFFHNELRES